MLLADEGREGEFMRARWQYRPVRGLLADREEGWGRAEKLCGVAIACPRCSALEAALWRRPSNGSEIYRYLYKCKNCGDLSWTDVETALTLLERSTSSGEATTLLS